MSLHPWLLSFIIKSFHSSASRKIIYYLKFTFCSFEQYHQCLPLSILCPLFNFHLFTGFILTSVMLLSRLSHPVRQHGFKGFHPPKKKASLFLHDVFLFASDSKLSRCWQFVMNMQRPPHHPLFQKRRKASYSLAYWNLRCNFEGKNYVN